MKYIAGGMLLVLVLLAYMSVSVGEAYAFGISRPFGGLVTISQTPDVTCYTGTGPMVNDPAGSTMSEPFYYPDFNTSMKETTPPEEDEWVLGLYDETMDEESCYTGVDPYEIPYPVYDVTLFGHSGAGL